MRRIIALSVSAALLLAGCAGIRVETDHERGVDYEAMRTFAWMEPVPDEVEDPVLDSELLARKVHAATVATLASRGYREVAPDYADFYVTYHTSSRERVSGSGPRVLIGLGSSHRRFQQTVFITDDFGVQSYQEGTLMIDVIDTSNMQLVWRGWTRGFVSPQRFTDEAVDEKVAAILDRFPPGR